MTPKQQEALALLKQGKTRQQIADELGISLSSVRDRLYGANQKLLPAGITTALESTGLSDPNLLHSGWLKTDDASLYFVAPKSETKESLDDLIDYISYRVQHVTPLTAPQSPAECRENLLTLYPIADAHMGMRAEAREAGEDYDLDAAANRIRLGITQLVNQSPPSEEAIILDVGDLTHADDKNYVTPRSKHQLDMASTQFDSVDIAIEVLGTSIMTALFKHKRVRVRILRGNHNENSYIAIMFALRERFRECDNVIIESTPSDFFVYRFGEVMIAAHHGDKAKPERLAMYMAHEWAKDWGETKWRYFFTGHLHHAKLQDIGGVQFEQLRAVTSRDAYATSHGYVGMPQMQAITFDKNSGEKSRVKINF